MLSIFREKKVLSQSPTVSYSSKHLTSNRDDGILSSMSIASILQKASEMVLEDVDVCQSENKSPGNQDTTISHPKQRRTSLSEDCPALLELATHHKCFKKPDLERCDSFVLHRSSLKIGEQVLGQGAAGEVRRAECKGRQVAVKTLFRQLDVKSPQGRALLKEIGMMSHAFRHSNVVEFYGIYEHEGLPWLVMELMPGGNLEQHYDNKKQARRSRQWSPKTNQALSWVHDILSALKFLHAQQPPVFHRDIKPSNMLLTGNCKTIKIGDFGVSRRCPRSSSEPLSSAVSCEEVGAGNQGDACNLTGTTGTFRYMAPEIFRQDADYTEAVDVYSFSFLTWFIFAGGHPFSNLDGQTVAVMASTYDHFRPAQLSERVMPRMLTEMMKRSWAMKAEDRPRADELLHELEELKMRRAGCGIGWI
eukprot:766661-Hanusia_phi.AAC.5